MTAQTEQARNAREGAAPSSELIHLSSSNEKQRPAQTGNRIWILDDDPVHLNLIKTKLANEGFDAHAFSHTEIMLGALQTSQAPPDIFIVDLHLGTSKYNGLSVCRTIVTLYQRPVIILTGDQSAEKTIACLEAGAEDYVLKSCQFKELRARIIARLRKTPVPGVLYTNRGISSETSRSLLRLGPLQLNQHTAILQCLRSGTDKIQLSHTESQILSLLMTAPDQTLQRSDAYFALFQREIPPENRSIDITISRLRRRLRALGKCYSIRSLRGTGYKLLVTARD